MPPLRVPVTWPLLCDSVFMGQLLSAVENRLLYFDTAHHTASSSLPLKLFLSVYCPSLHLLMSNAALSCGFVCKEKTQASITIKRRKKKDKNPTILKVKNLEWSAFSFIAWSLSTFSLLFYQYSTLFRPGIWLSESPIRWNLFQHTVKTNRLFVENPVVYVFQKRVTAVHFLWSLLFQMEQMAVQNKHLYVNCYMFTCKAATV